MRKSGFFLAWRSVWRHKAFKNVIESAIWLYMVSSASHKDKEARFIDSPIFVKRGEVIFPLRKNAKMWNISYAKMRSFILRLRKKKMITVRNATLIPATNHPYRKICVINIVNYEKFQQYDMTADQLDTTNSAYLNNNISKQLLSNSKVHQEVDKIEYKIVETWGDEDIVERDGKKYRRHRWKKIPMIPL